jgi:2-polyprenyl-6-methoxyphenol hydroxylase-like FAD-dependent oxidoreductase
MTTSPMHLIQNQANGTESIPTVIIGGGQAGLAMGYHLQRQGEQFVILDAQPRIGEPGVIAGTRCVCFRLLSTRACRVGRCR